MNEPHPPFTSLGKHLKYVREQLNRTLAEVSGAVEIDEKVLERIESGLERPSEDILMLLISHFEVQDQEAVQLWELAGYDGDVPEQFRPTIDIQNGKATVMLLALDMRTMYSDGLVIDQTPAGLTLNFTQASSGQPSPVARVGMSYDQAEQVLNQLQHAILQARYQRGPKKLPPTTK
jgi:transcriptional regulator with XRE-family HTH domain